jgi:hypothetical protein
MYSIPTITNILPVFNDNIVENQHEVLGVMNWSKIIPLALMNDTGTRHVVSSPGLVKNRGAARLHYSLL